MSRETPGSAGQRMEALARAHLERQGLLFLEANYRCRAGEIDLVMREGTELVFIEVRFRASSRFGSGAESVDRRKQERLLKTAQHYLQRHGEQACRFDVVALSGADVSRLQWIRNAFGLS